MFQRIFRSLSKQDNDLKTSMYYFDALFKTLNPDKLGYGRDVHSPKKNAYWPPAYALLLSAELSRRNTKTLSVFENCDSIENTYKCGQWLLNHIGCASTLAPLWTLPYPRKIWEDREPVKENTAFCIPTCHSIQAMCEMSQDVSLDESLQHSAKEAAISAAMYYAKKCYDETSDGIVFWYSPLIQHSFHVTNATAMMAGQLQRVSKLAPSPDSTILERQADRAVNQLLKLKLEHPNGWGWCYFGEKIPSNKKNRTNDLLHEAFICNGLLEYKQFGGTLGNEFRYLDLYNSLCKFYRENGLYEFSDSETVFSRKKKLARVQAIAHALYVASRLELLLEHSHELKLSKILYNALCQKYTNGKDLYYRPDGDVVTRRVRVVAHVLLGLAEYTLLLEREKRGLSGCLRIDERTKRWY